MLQGTNQSSHALYQYQPQCTYSSGRPTDWTTLGYSVDTQGYHMPPLRSPACITPLCMSRLYTSALAHIMSLFHTGIEPLRGVLGAGANTLLAPTNLADWEPAYQKPTWYDKKMSVEEAVDAASQTTDVK